jgi:hypothetical protein
VLAIFAVVCCLALPADASGQTREHTLQWIQPEGPEPSGFLTYLGAEPGVYSEVLDLGPVDPDPDGTRRATLILDAYTTYYIAISAYNDLGESPLSDEVFSPSDACGSLLCDDGDACNGIETCSPTGLCVSGAPLSCGEPTQCQVPACDPVVGCVLFNVADGKPCSDGDRLTRGDRCQSGVCVGRSKKRADGLSRKKVRRPKK